MMRTAHNMSFAGSGRRRLGGPFSGICITVLRSLVKSPALSEVILAIRLTVSLAAALLLLWQVQTLCHGIARVPEPLVLIALFRKFAAVLQVSCYVGPNDGGNPLRAS